MDLLIYSTFNSPRLAFICHQVFDIWLGLEHRITTHVEVYQQYEGMKLNYSEEKILKEELFLAACHLLKATSIENTNLTILKHNKIPALFKTEVLNSALPFDLFATIFFHLSRYEEYLSFQADQHERFTYKESWAYQNDCLQVPIVDQLILVLEQLIREKYPQLVFTKRTFCFKPTYDIDMAWAYKHKGLVRTLGGLLKDTFKGNRAKLQEKWQVLVHDQIDPFDTFDLFYELDQQYNMAPIYFFLLGDHGKYDENIDVRQYAFRQLIQHIATNYPIGIHPSYRSNSNVKRLKKEIGRLKNITNQPISKSRQHFLKLHLPTTYRNLLKYNITEDYSMGYAGQIGFRAGTSLPFYWYDLQLETGTELLIHPFQIMDVTLKEYLCLTPEQAKNSISEMIQTIRSVNGTFCSLWHNSSFSTIGGWENWKEVYIHLLEEASRSQK